MKREELEKQVKDIKNTFRLIKLFVSYIVLQASIIFVAISVFAITQYTNAQSQFLNICQKNIANSTIGLCKLSLAPQFPYWTIYMFLAFFGILFGALGTIEFLGERN